jgi:hypothetical protein
MKLAVNADNMGCCLVKRESSANIKAAPTAYKQSEPPKAQNILEFDCRGLEFTEFLPEVRVYHSLDKSWFTNMKPSNI